jgi:hypothetical protein
LNTQEGNFNIKGNCISRIFFSQDIGFVWGIFRGVSGGFGIEVEREHFQRSGRAYQGV